MWSQTSKDVVYFLCLYKMIRTDEHLNNTVYLHFDSPIIQIINSELKIVWIDANEN